MLAKVLLLGDSSVGKTCLLLRVAEDTFATTHLPTIGICITHSVCVCVHAPVVVHGHTVCVCMDTKTLRVHTHMCGLTLVHLCACGDMDVHSR